LSPDTAFLSIIFRLQRTRSYLETMASKALFPCFAFRLYGLSYFDHLGWLVLVFLPWCFRHLLRPCPLERFLHVQARGTCCLQGFSSVLLASSKGLTGVGSERLTSVGSEGFTGFSFVYLHLMRLCMTSWNRQA
jgi:hypothetical protein